MRVRVRCDQMKSPRSILKLLYLFLLFATLTWHSTSGQLVSTKNDNQDVLGVHVPPGRDGWCRKFCESRIACENLFGDDHMGVLLKTRFSMLDGPGEHLFHGRLFGNTVTRQSFKTQFVLDVSYALQISPCKVYVVDISPEQYKGKEGEPSWWDVDNVLISFKFFNTTVDHLKELTRQVQEMGSQIYQGQVTRAIDLKFGVVVPKWDFSLKLMYQIDLVGADKVKMIDGAPILNQGGLGLCGESGVAVQVFEMESLEWYCEFESYFRRDLAAALTVEVTSVNVLFIKPFGEDAVIISFRFIPLSWQQKLDMEWLKRREQDLVSLVRDPDSSLYGGNVTFRVDPTWGLSGSSTKLRSQSHRLNRSTRQSPPNLYDRCKDTQRCSRGWNRYNSSHDLSTSTMQRFAGGEHEDITLYLDFEDWRQGTAGWRGTRTCDARNSGCQTKTSTPKGMHWSPFDYTSLGPNIPSYNTSVNNGLVLNSAQKIKEEAKQKKWINEISRYLDWIELESNTTSLDAKTRSRENIRASLNRTYSDYKLLLGKEEDKLSMMSRSQCANQYCHLLFNTSNLLMSGAINATGTIGHNSDGTEVAVWTFDSIDLGPEVEVELTGQRAMVLLSKSSVIFDTHFIARPGTLGGFPGGYSTYRKKEYRFVSVCDDEKDSLSRTWKCRGDHPLSESIANPRSNNVNGPGSPSVRYYYFTIQTSARIKHEIKAIKTNANQGQMLEGGILLHFNGYTSSFIRHDATAAEFKGVLEDTLNPSKINILDTIDRSNIVPGIGRVEVSRVQHGYSGGYEWRITFLSAIGNIGEDDSGPMSITNILSGIGASANIETVTDGNTISGTFALKFLGAETRRLQHDISGPEMELAFVNDVPGIINASVTRSGTHPKCNDGFCRNSPDQTGGYTWTLSIATNVANLSPFTPTSSDFDSVGDISEMRVENNLTGCVESICPNISISAHTHTPFSLSYGGGGGSFGGSGGVGFGYIPRREVYGDEFMTNLYGGSGGALGFVHPYEKHMIGLPAKVRGGSGGGALAIIAKHDIVLGGNSALSCNGENGWGSFMTAGGGGSGGSILLSAGGTVKATGDLEVKGGDGGVPLQEGAKFRGGAGGGGRIAVYGESVSIQDFDVYGGICSDEVGTGKDCSGTHGSFFKDAGNLQTYSIDTSTGAMHTNNSLHLHSFPTKEKLIGEEPRRFSGPIYEFHEAAMPERVSFFVKVSCKDNAPSQNWEALLSLIPAAENNETIASLGFSIGSVMKHGLVTSGGSFRVENTQSMHKFHATTKFNHWYKLDIQLDWIGMMYSVHLDDQAVVENSRFNCTSIGSISISVRPSNVDIWFDELFVGNDATMGFRCPALVRGTPIEMPPVGKRDWQVSELGASNTHHRMTRHDSHLSRRDISSGFNKGKIKSFDGQGHSAFTSEVKYAPHENNDSIRSRMMRLGDIMEIEDANGPLRIWYGEHQLGTDNSFGFTGGIGACSTTDMKSWKNEGILLHNMNVTDMVRGTKGPFHIEKPKVLYNANTRKYVMWMIVDNTNRSLAMAGVATSDYASGPFTFIRSFYPDGNKTRDQALHQEDDGTAYLIRTYYDTIEYVLPSPIMQPIWESVKNEDGSINFPLTYHRAHYEEGYDDYHDIYLQRWRGEDKPWKVLCIDRMTNREREIPYGAKGDEQCTGPFEFKRVIGQGDPSYEVTREGIKSRFLDPNALSNNVWKPSSVPGVKAQPWKANYEAGTCGIRLTNGDTRRYDPGLDEHTAADRHNCSDIADNPIHPTLPDQLHGKPQIVQKRRAKFIAVSQLTFDYLNTNGALSKFEGELENGADLSFIVNRAKESNSFRWKPGKEIDSTFTPQVHHPSFESLTTNNEFHQYDSEYNDKSFYSLQCVVDGICPS